MRGNIESGEGTGRNLVTDYFPTGPGLRTIQRHLDIADCDIKA